jgi:hypothetical protein
MTTSAFIQRVYPNMNIRDAIKLISDHRLNLSNFLKAECRHKKNEVVDVVEYYETKNN